MKVFYECDRKACNNCNNEQCKHTEHIEHAINFKKMEDDVYFENVCDDYFDIDFDKNAVSVKLKKKYIKALKKLCKRCKAVAKSMKLLGEFVPDFNVSFYNLKGDKE